MFMAQGVGLGVQLTPVSLRAVSFGRGLRLLEMTPGSGFRVGRVSKPKSVVPVWVP